MRTMSTMRMERSDASVCLPSLSAVLVVLRYSRTVSVCTLRFEPCACMVSRVSDRFLTWSSLQGEVCGCLPGPSLPFLQLSWPVHVEMSSHSERIALCFRLVPTDQWLRTHIPLYVT